MLEDYGKVASRNSKTCFWEVLGLCMNDFGWCAPLCEYTPDKIMVQTEECSLEIKADDAFSPRLIQICFALTSTSSMFWTIIVVGSYLTYKTKTVEEIYREAFKTSSCRRLLQQVVGQCF